MSDLQWLTRLRRQLLRMLAASLLFAATGWAQFIERAPSNFKLDGDIGEWDPNTTSFNRYETWGHKPIWIAQSSEGLVLAGSSIFLAPTNNGAELLTKGHFELWLSETEGVEMPPINWAGDWPLKADFCAAIARGVESRTQSCVQWLKGQPAYREKLLGLFTRMWRIAPGLTEEAYATKIYGSLTEAQQKALKPLKPSGNPVAKFVFDTFQQNFSFEILVPWEAFPPANRLHLERVRLVLNIVDGEKIRASTQWRADEQREKPALPSYALSPAIMVHFTPCEYPLAGVSGEPAFYFMDRSLGVRMAFLLQNDLPSTGIIGPPRPDDVSPNVKVVEHFVQTLGPGEFLCSPPTSYRRNRVIKRFPFELGPPKRGLFGSATPPATVPVLRLPNGTRLIKDGPAWWYVYQTYTACGGCPLATLSIFALTSSGEIKEALTLSARVGGIELDDYDIEVSPDWRIVKEFKGKNQNWVSRRFCLNGEIYRSCGEGSQPPPLKRGLVLPRQ
jgi:hypothetical protein